MSRPDHSSLIDRLQAYFRHSARRRYECASVPPFTVFFHPEDPLKYFNYAIPDDPRPGDSSNVSEALGQVRSLFAERGRSARFEFIEEYAPGLSPVLQAERFAEESRRCLMVCTPTSVRSVPPVPDLIIIPVTQESVLRNARSLVVVQHRGFDPDEPAILREGEAEGFLERLGGGSAFLARLDGQPVGAGMYTEPLDGVVEVVGVTALKAFRRRGIASAVVAQAVEDAFARGVRIACLTAENERVGLVYRRVGFQVVASMLACS